jgi:hypothetical protein
MSALTWLTKYIHYWNLQFLNHVIIIKTSVVRSRAYVTLAGFSYPAVGILDLLLPPKHV